jgi:hypothetical protein
MCCENLLISGFTDGNVNAFVEETGALWGDEMEVIRTFTPFSGDNHAQ